MTRALLEQALEALECAYSENYDGAKIHGAKVAIRAHLAQPQGEPGVSCGDCPTRDYKAPATAPDEQIRKDAERYRWCVKNNLVLAGGTREFGWQIAPVGSEWNRFIDAAMKGTP
jgi:hypothetical protein